MESIGDGATINRTTLINVLRASGDIYTIVLGVHDCSSHMASGCNNDAS